jgi:hypothetical protein
MSNYERVLKNSLAAYEHRLRDTLYPKLEQVLPTLQPGDTIPIIGDVVESPPLNYRENLADRIVRAAVARAWFRFEAPKWGPPLPISQQEIIARLNTREGNRHPGRHQLVAQYGKHLRDLGWHIERAMPFEEYCAYEINPDNQAERLALEEKVRRLEAGRARCR